MEREIRGRKYEFYSTQGPEHPCDLCDITKCAEKFLKGEKLPCYGSPRTYLKLLDE